MMNRPQPGPDLEMENQVNSWLHDSDLQPEEAERGLDRLMQALPATPQSRRRSLGWWFDRGDQAPRGSAAHELASDTRQRNRMMFTATAVAAGLALLAVSVSVVDFDGSVTRIVAADGSGDHLSITEAVEAADDGDIIVVRSGVYGGSVMVDKDLTITGERNGGETIVRIENTALPRRYEDNPFAFRLQDSVAQIGHFTIQGPPESTPFFVHGGDVTIHDIRDDLYARETKQGGTIFSWVDGDATGTIRDIATRSGLWVMDDATLDILGNRIGGILSVSDYAAPRIVDNEIASIEVHDRANPTIEGNLVDMEFNINGQPAECGIAVDAKTTGPTVLRNVFRNGSAGICARNGSGGTYIGNRIENAHTGLFVNSDATFKDNIITGGQNGIAISEGSPMLEGNDVSGAEVGLVMTAYATPTLVNNTFCGNGTDFLPVVGAQPSDFSGNTFCDGTGGP